MSLATLDSPGSRRGSLLLPAHLQWRTRVSPQGQARVRRPRSPTRSGHLQRCKQRACLLNSRVVSS
eukprot:scaffold38947_cov34-Phaeocystis_antarctica.AAC.1